DDDYYDYYSSDDDYYDYYDDYSSDDDYYDYGGNDDYESKKSELEQKIQTIDQKTQKVNQLKEKIDQQGKQELPHELRQEIQQTLADFYPNLNLNQQLPKRKLKKMLLDVIIKLSKQRV